MSEAICIIMEYINRLQIKMFIDIITLKILSFRIIIYKVVFAFDVLVNQGRNYIFASSIFDEQIDT